MRGWGTEDRSTALEEAQSRFREWVGNPEMSEFGGGCVNGFLLGAEWMKARMEAENG